MANSVHVSTLLNHITHITCIFFSPHNADECSASFKLLRSVLGMFCFVLWLLQLFRHINISPETLPLCFIQLCCALCAFAVFFSICWCVFLELAVCLTSQSHHKKVYFYSFLFVQDCHSKTFTSVASPSHTNPLHVFHSHILFHRLLFYKTRYGFGSRGQQLLLL